MNDCFCIMKKSGSFASKLNLNILLPLLIYGINCHPHKLGRYLDLGQYFLVHIEETFMLLLHYY